MAGPTASRSSRRGAELLDEKYRALVRERWRLAAGGHRGARRVGAQRARGGALARARRVIGGERGLALSAAAARPAEVTVRWRTILGVACPVEASVTRYRGAPSLMALGGSAALVSAAVAHRRALEAAVQVAVAEARAAARRRGAARDEAAAQRDRAPLDPGPRGGAAELELTLEELEREEGARVRRLTRAP